MLKVIRKLFSATQEASPARAAADGLQPSPAKPASAEACDTDAVLAILHPVFHGNNEVGVVIGMDNERTIAADRALIVKYRTWLETQPRKVRKAYEYWLEHYAEGCNEAERAIRNNARQKFHDDWERDVSTKLRAAEERAKKYPKP